jgi:hypothetical protein
VSSTSRTFRRLALAWSLALALGVMSANAALETAGARAAQKRTGTIPAQHLAGKIGEALSDGRWRFEVVSVKEADSYALKTDAEPYGYTDVSSFDSTKRTLIPKSGYRLIVIECRATNEQKSQKRLWVSASDSANVRTALSDTDGSSHVPIAYDFEGGPVQTKPLQSSETITFPVVFSVPQSVQPKELTFTLAANGEREMSKDVRVVLTESHGTGEIKRVDETQF